MSDVSNSDVPTTPARVTQHTNTSHPRFQRRVLGISARQQKKIIKKYNRLNKEAGKAV